MRKGYGGDGVMVEGMKKKFGKEVREETSKRIAIGHPGPFYKKKEERNNKMEMRLADKNSNSAVKVKMRQTLPKRQTKKS